MTDPASASAPPPASGWTHLLLFDGVCHLCNHAVQFIIPRDGAGIVHYCSIQSELGSRLYREHGLDPEKPNTMLLITPQGGFTASDAALEIARVLGDWWRLALVFKVLPKFVRDAVYYLIASNRYRLFGKDEQCWLPKPEWRKRFVG